MNGEKNMFEIFRGCGGLSQPQKKSKKSKESYGLALVGGVGFL